MNDVAIAPTRHRLTTDDLTLMIEAGMFRQGDRIELIEGDLIDMAPIGQSHESIVNALTEALVLACAGQAIVSPQNSVRLDLSSQPQPDFAVFRRRADFYATGQRPTPADVLLLIEVSESSLHFDRTVKLPLYARAGIGEFWIVDIKRQVIDAYTRPEGNVYASHRHYHSGDRVTLALAPDIAVTLNLTFG